MGRAACAVLCCGAVRPAGPAANSREVGPQDPLQQGRMQSACIWRGGKRSIWGSDGQRRRHDVHVARCTDAVAATAGFVTRWRRDLRAFCRRLARATSVQA
eukprot:355265-Chlamydomonas_euryale.AAC.24